VSEREELRPDVTEGVGRRRIKCPMCGRPVARVRDATTDYPVGWHCINPQCPAFMRIRLEGVSASRGRKKTARATLTTTIRVNPAVWREAKLLAVSRGKTIRKLLEEILRRELEEAKKRGWEVSG